MRAIIEDENADDGVKLRSYCQKHSVNSKKEKCPGSGSEEEEVKRKRRKDMTSEEKNQARAARLQEIEGEFDRHVSVKDVSTHLLDVDQDAINYIYNYWKMKRRAGRNRPLLPPKADDSELLSHRQEQADLDKMKMFVQLRQDLERVRNLCYMVSRREKLSRSFFRMREQTFHKQVAVLAAEPALSGPDLAAIIEANHGPSIYDRLYSHPNAADHKNDFDDLLARIAPPDSGDDKKKDRNGMVRGSKSSNPYKKHYVNGSRRSGSMYSGLSSEESAPEISRSTRYRGRAIGSSTDDDAKKPSASPKKKVSPKSKGKRSPKKNERKKKKVPQSKALVLESSSEDEALQSRMKKDRSRSKTLQHLEKEMVDAVKSGQSATDSDDLMPIRTTRQQNSKFPNNIYSDSSEESSGKVDLKADKIKAEKSKPDKSPDNDSQQPLPRTKGAMKEFIPTQPEKKSPTKVDRPAPKKRGRKPSNKEKKTPTKSNDSDDEAKDKENIKFSKQSKDHPSDLIVPQRQAAKKASENMRSTTAVKKEESGNEKTGSGDENKPKPKIPIKSKGKEVPKDIPAKVGRKKSSKDVEKETIAYVPQRQAAKKAAAHIKSGLGTKAPVADTSDTDKKKESDKPEPAKLTPKKEEGKSAKTPQKESSSSSSNSSSSSYSSSSSSDDEPEKPGIKPTAKAREIKPAVRQPSMFSPPGTRPTVDLPFLDKVSRPLSSTSASSDTDSSQASRFSGSGSPSPKRPRRRRKGKSLSTDTSPRKAPDKKLKTSERGPECGVSSPAPEGEEPRRADDARAATRARTRSITTSGNLPHKLDARQRKPSKDDNGYASGSNKTPKEGSQSRELPTPERKTDEEVKTEVKEEPLIEPKTVKASPTKIKPRVSIDDKDKIKTPEADPIQNKTSPRKTADVKHKPIPNRRMSVKEVTKELVTVHEAPRESAKRKILTRHDEQNALELSRTISSLSPAKQPQTEEKLADDDKKIPIPINDFHQNDKYAENEKHWLEKAPSPSMHPPPVEKLGSHDKYMTEDTDSADKNSIKMIAKIQANLNENTMIKSPKTPMDARTLNMDSIEVENPTPRIMRKRSTLEEKKFIAQDASHVQGVEISKSAKIPSVNPCRSMFSPQPKDNELFEFEMMAVDDGFNNDEMIKPFTSYPEFFFKEDSKEQGVQETLNLVDRLRMQLSSKKVPAENSAQDEAANEEKEPTEEDLPTSPVKRAETPPPNKNAATDIHEPKTPANDLHLVTHKPLSAADHVLRRNDMHDNKDCQPIPMTSNDKWRDLPMQHNDVEPNDRKYDHRYNDELKEPATIQSDVQSVSEVGDTISLSKQSDDSQSLSVVDNSMHSNDQELHLDNQNYENNNSQIHSDCATISSPYVSQEKWRENKIITRRSSASSTTSEGSICSQKTDLKSHMNSCDSQISHQSHMIPEIERYAPIPAYACSVEPSMPLNQYSSYPPDASPFLSSMGSLPLFGSGACASAQLTLPSPGPGLYAPPGLSYTSTPLIQPLSKPAFPTLCAAFTSSSQNIALTTAMIAPPTPKPVDSPRDDPDVSNSDKFSIHVVSSPSVDSFNDTSNKAPTKSNDSTETMLSLHAQESKSPIQPKLPKTKFPGKSPGKSPGISPKQSEPSKGKRASNRSNRSARGRGRSKSRGQGVPGYEYMGNSIQSKLVGTVYDFDEEIANDGVDLKALRERRKSVDLRDDRKSEHSYKDSSQSPRVASPQPAKKPSVEVNEAKPATPEQPERADSPARKSAERGPGFSQVQPVLPGPVDMRTYKLSFEGAAPPAPDAFHSHLLAFASGTADQQLGEIDEEDEKQLHSALMASKPRLAPPTPQPPVQLAKEIFTPQLPKVSLSDSRNQLKVKIKGPFLDANYSSTVTPVAPQPPPPVDVSASLAAAGGPSSMVTGSTNLRRMRKKELLRQYWTQDMNMDDPTAGVPMGAAPPPAAPPPIARTVITIPKAVASMTSIPTREDYKTETPVEKKKRKMTSGLSRELRHLEVSMNDDVDVADESKLATLSAVVTPPAAHKRRGRVPKPGRPATSPVAPKLKIKIGSNTVQQVEEPAGFQFRPPKKRLHHPIPKPSFEDLRRESMKYRRMVMADFEEDEKTKKVKPSKSEKRKRKKDKKQDKLQVVNSESESATKLIIKIKRPKEEEAAAAGAAPAPAPEAAVDPFDYDPTLPDPLAIDPPAAYAEASGVRKIRTAKVTPIRLKIARSSQGSGYVMKEPPGDAAPAPSPRPRPRTRPRPRPRPSPRPTRPRSRCRWPSINTVK
ncbi:hypothetical protein MSG28_001171 [Choristoneura fumiferana]|uniref:Uncharacterized protein n=2 Tax=Choristoneura fumiferana TaxID=7141 RepID=A0ACC0K4C4_CHOFU|nr:hypothetical protein MSG28_001171 [Choristoneura fumiferana]